MRKLTALLLSLALSSGLLYAEPEPTGSYIDQALEQLRIIEENNLALQQLLSEREATIIASEKSLKEMQAQFQNLEASYSLLKSVTKWQRVALIVASSLAIVEGVIIASK